MTSARSFILTSLLSGLTLLMLAACSGGGWSVNPGIDLAGPRSPNLAALAGGGPASATFPGSPSADSLLNRP